MFTLESRKPITASRMLSFFFAMEIDLMISGININLIRRLMEAIAEEQTEAYN